MLENLRLSSLKQSSEFDIVIRLDNRLLPAAEPLFNIGKYSLGPDMIFGWKPDDLEMVEDLKNNKVGSSKKLKRDRHKSKTKQSDEDTNESRKFTKHTKEEESKGEIQESQTRNEVTKLKQVRRLKMGKLKSQPLALNKQPRPSLSFLRQQSPTPSQKKHKLSFFRSKPQSQL